MPIRPTSRAGLACLPLLLAACVTVETERTPVTAGRPRPAPSAAGDVAAGEAAPEPIPEADRPAPPSGPLGPHVMAEIQARGTIPYDNMTLPIVSPDGRFVATQTGLSPTWDTVLAEEGAAVPMTTRIEIYEIPAAGTDPPRLHEIVTEPVILGRGCDDLGFLVEAPRDDGSRWIGLAGWADGAVTWLVKDAQAVSAFAMLGPGGRLAWSSRPLGAAHFDLVIRSNDEEWRIPAQGSDWLMPVWSGASGGDGLFAFMLRGDMLDAVHMVGADYERMRRTIQRLPLASTGASIQTAYQALNALVGTPVGPEAKEDRLPFFHPVRRRAAIWSPPGPATLLESDSIAAVLDPDDPEYVLIVTPGDLIRRPLATDQTRSKLAPGTHVPRRTGSRERPWILLEPADGVISLTVMRLWPAGTRVGG